MTSHPTWDAICVGAGLTSLAFACFYQKRYPGGRVLVIDKHSLAGGYATEFRRPKAKAIFECSLHKLSGMREGGNLRRLLQNLEVFDDLDLRYHGELFAASGGGEELVIPVVPEAAKETLSRAFPQEAAGIAHFFEDLEVHGRNGYFQFQIMAGTFDADLKAMRFARKHLRKKTVIEALDELISDQRLKAILGAPCIYVGGFPEDLSYLYYLHVLYANLCQGTAYIAGSAQYLSDKLVALIRSGGGEVILRRPVDKVLTDENDEAVGVVTADGILHQGRRIIVNASPQFALDNLFDSALSLEKPKNMIRQMKPSYATTTLYAVLDRPPAEVGLTAPETMIFSDKPDAGMSLRHAARETPRDECRSEEAYWRASPMEVTNYHVLDPKQNHVIVANVLDRIDHWPERSVRSSFQDYKTKKNRAMDILVSRLTEHYPGMGRAIVFKEMATPATYQRFTNNTGGAGYGALVGPDIAGHGFHYGFPIRGVDFMSAWTAGPGYEAAIGYAEARVESWSKQ